MRVALTLLLVVHGALHLLGPPPYIELELVEHHVSPTVVGRA